MITGTTGTGLDQILDIIAQDEGLARRTPADQIEAGAAAADAMNAMIVEGIVQLGLARDGKLTAGDVRDLSDWISENRAPEFTAAHGDDENGIETGFHLIQGDGGVVRIFGQQAINTVADGIYHLVFGYDKGRIINEDGNANARLESIAWWLNEFLEEDLANAAQGIGPLAPATEPPARSHSGMDQIVDVILSDPSLERNISTSQMESGADAAAQLNDMIESIIIDHGLANDGRITASDAYEINAVIRENPDLLARFIALHGDDENGIETGFHLVQGDGAETRLFGFNAVNTVADGIFHIGFETEQGRFLNEDGNKNAGVELVASWIERLMANDLADGTFANPDVSPLPEGSTGTGLDAIAEAIASDAGLERKIAVRDIAGGIDAANTISGMIVDGIHELGLANNGRISSADIRDLNAWIRSDADRLATFIAAHGDDEDGIETGFHLVQGDGAQGRMFGENTVNTVADGIFHIGFDIQDGRFLNEDGNANQTVSRVAAWIDTLLSDSDMDALQNLSLAPYATGTTGTSLDGLIDIINDDPRLQERISTSQIAEGAHAADGLNALIIEGLTAIGAAADGAITTTDLYRLNDWIRSDADRLSTFVALHGDDENGLETGFHNVQGDGAVTELNGMNAVNTVMDGIYHVGFDIQQGRFLNEDGAKNASVSSVAKWLDALLRADIENGALYNADFDPDLVDTGALVADHSVFSLANAAPDGTSGYVISPHQSDMALGQGTVAFNFSADEISGARKVLFSKDALGYGDGGHTTIWHQNSHVYVRIQDAESSHWLVARKVLQDGLDHHLAFTFDGQTASLFIDGALADTEETTASWAANDAEFAIGANVWGRDAGHPNWVRDVFDGEITDVQIFDQALTETQILALAGNPAPDPAPVLAPVEASDLMIGGTTGTGLDRIINIILKDEGLAARIDAEQIVAGAQAADGMNAMIVEALVATGVANDGTLTAGDIRVLSDWIAENRAQAFAELHGDDENGTETGFHLVQGDGGQERIFGEAAINTVADGLYHLVFGYEGANIINEDGNKNARLEKMAWWMSELLSDELAAAAQGEGPIYSPDADPKAHAETGTGLDYVYDVIFNDPGLSRNVSTTDAQLAAQSAHEINLLILDAIEQMALTVDGDLTASDLLAISEYIRGDAGRLAQFVAAHGDDENGVETGFHFVQGDGGETRYLGFNAINTVFDGIYHVGFESVNGHFLNEDGNKNARVELVADWMSELLADDIAAGTLSGPGPDIAATGTGLDLLTDLILDDNGLERRISELDIRGGAEAANTLNGMILEAIRETGVATNGEIKASDVRDINAYIRADAARLSAFTAAHGDDENGVETGFHLVQGDGASTRLFDQNAVNTVADGLYHVGFEIRDGRFLNEDGNANASVTTVAGWLNELLSSEDLTDLSNGAETPYLYGTTGTGLDALVDIITEDDGLANRISTSQIRGGAEAAQGLNEIILDAIRATGVANDGEISKFDVAAINAEIRSDAATLATFTTLHGDDDGAVETGFHLVQGDGGATGLFGKNAINTVADGIYHIGFEIDRGRFVNEDGARNASLSDVASWLDSLLQDDLATGGLQNAALMPQNIDLAALAAGRVLEIDAPIEVTKSGGQVEFASDPALALDSGTILFGFTANSPEGTDLDTLFSRDARGRGDGEITAWVKGKDLTVRIENAGKVEYLQAKDAIEAGQTHDAALTFDGTHAMLYLDGQVVDVETTAANWLASDDALAVGASLMGRRAGQTTSNNLFDGEIDHFAVYDSALGQGEITAAFGVTSYDYYDIV